jgi:hypothetical protein
MVNTDRPDGSPFADLAVLPPAAIRPRPPRRWALLAAVALAVVTLHGYAFSLLTGLEIVLLVEEAFADANLENDEIGNDPDLATNYNIDRIDEVTIPGPAVPGAPPGFGLAGMQDHRAVPIELSGLEQFADGWSTGRGGPHRAPYNIP